MRGLRAMSSSHWPLAMVVTLAAALLAAPVSAFRPAAAAAAPAACPAVAPDLAAARSAAGRCHLRVEIAAARSEKSQVFANANGTFTAIEAATVQRVARADGTWVKPDPTLRRLPDGSYAPVAAALRMSFPAGGANATVTIAKGPAELSLRWPGTLPVPRAVGNTLTYAEVLPGVDLRVTSDVEGFEETLVVKSAAAAANPALSTIRFATTTKGLQLTAGAGGSLAAVSDASATVFGSGTPTMWDSSGTMLPAAGGAQGALDGARVATMPLQVAGDHIAVTPDRSVLIGASVKYPVYLDPAIFRTSWTMINSTFPNQSYWAYDRHDCPPGYSGDCAKVGYTDSGTHMIYRSSFEFSTASYLGKHVLDAKLSMDLIHSWSCTDTRTDVNITNGINSGTTWNNNAGSWSGFISSVWNNSCHDARRRTEWGLTGLAQTAVAQGWSTTTVGLKAGDEANHNAWKKFDVGTAYLTVTYNSYPSAPDQITVQDAACATGTGRPFVKVANPQLRARIMDADGGLLNATFWWWPLGGARNDTDKVVQVSVGAGTQAVISIPTGRLVEGTTYVLQSQAFDGTDNSQFSSTCEFTVDASPPGPVSAVSSTDYPADGALHGGAGVSGTFLLSPPSPLPADLAGFAYTLDTGLTASQAWQVAASATTHDATVSITPPNDGVQTLRVWARDNAGNFSATYRTYTFGVRSGAGPDARWSFDEGTGTSSADATGHGNSLVFNNASWGAGHRGTGSSLSLDGIAGRGSTTAPLATTSPTTGAATTVRTDANFTVSAFVKLAASGGTTQKDVVTQDGTRVSAFLLGYSPTDDRWRFAMASADADNRSLVTVLSNAAPAVGVWTYLVASYDASTHQLRLYVDGVAQTATATLSGGFNASGHFAIGRGFYAASNTDYFNGLIDDVRVYARVVSPTDPEFANPLRPNPPAISFPAGTSVQVGQSLPVQLSGSGDPTVTVMKYSLVTQTLSSSVTLPTAGGSATVSVTPTTAGATFFFAAAVDGAGRQSDPAAGIITVGSTPALSGTVYDANTGTPVSGATVRLDPVGLVVTTGASGAYSFTGMAQGLYTVTASVASACGSIATSQVQISRATFLDLSLSPQSDVFGYTCTVVAQAFAPADTTVLPLTGDDEALQITLPFGMPYYGSSSTTAWVSTNGFLSLSDPGGSSGDLVTSIPGGASPNGIIAPYWADLQLDGTASVRTAVSGTAPNRKFTVEWRNATFYGDFSRRVTFEAVLSEGGDVTFNYADLDSDSEKGVDASVGIESQGGNYGLQYSYRQAGLANGRAVTFHYPTTGHSINHWTVSGTLTSSGSPVSGATVTLLPSGLTATTSASGGYSFTEVESGEYTVSATVECGDASTTVSVSSNTTANLVLGPEMDSFGYRCTTATRTFTPADATVVPLTGDDASASVALPFALRYYGQSYSTAWLSTNGFLSFADPGGSFPDDRTALPNALGPNLTLYPYWNDLVIDGSASVRTAVTGSAPNRTFTVEWRNAYIFGNTSNRVTFEVVLSENGTITFDYTGLGNATEQGAGAVVGIENLAGDIGLTYVDKQPVLVDNRAVIFTPPAA